MTDVSPATPPEIGRVVLIVVHDPAHRAQLKGHLEDTPHHLVFAADGEDAFDRFSEVRPHLVIAHVNAARLDGTILCQLIRQQPRGDAVPVVLIGEELSDPEVARARVTAVDADAPLPMPFDGPELLACIAPLLANGRAPRPAPQANLQTPLSPPAAPPAEVAFGSVLMDFLDHSDEARPAEPAAVSPPGDMDTVVSFKNPFFEGDPPTSLHVTPISGEPEIASEPELEPPGVAMVTPELATDDPPTPVGRRASAVTRVTSDLTGDGPVTELARSPSSETAVVGVAVAEPEAPRPDPLEEPRISASSDVRAALEASPGESSKSRLIREVPLEATPSGAAEPAPEARRPARRGLDESQLGKRLSKRVRSLHRLLDEVDYYQLLGVETSAEAAEIRRAYFDLSIEFHPDRFFLLRSGDLKEKIYDIYRRIAEAYRVLGDAPRRRAYDEDRSLSSAKRAAPAIRAESEPPHPEDPSAPLDAEARTDRGLRFVDLAKEAHARGDLNRARLHLTFARIHEPENPSLEDALTRITRALRPTI